MSNEPELIDDRYQIRSVIARGNKTQICEVLEQGTGRHLAMKLVIQGKPEETKLAKAELKTEANIARTLLHPNIIRFEDFSTSRDATYMLMEFFRAANVKAQIKSEFTGLQSRARPLMEGVCQALIYIHEEGWVHLDLKPENILLNRSGEPKLIDFSLAKKFSQGLGKMLGMGGNKTIQGTRTYIAPEIIMRKAPSPQTDIYSLGVTFFEILAGKTPFQGFTPADLLNKHLKLPPPLPSAINPNLTPEADALLLAMLQKKPKDRPGSMQEVYAEIHRMKFFKEDVLEMLAAKQELEHKEKMSVVAMLDSRTDAQRSELLRADPTLAQQFEDDRAARQARRRPKPRAPSKGFEKAPETAPSPAQPPAMMPQPMMPQPMQPSPMMYPPMMPQQMMYPQMMPQPMMPPQMMPQPMMPPMMMPQPMLPPMMPQGGVPGYSPQPAPPAIPVPPTAPPSAPSPPASASAPPAPAPTKPDPDTMEYMTELPNVL